MQLVSSVEKKMASTCTNSAPNAVFSNTRIEESCQIQRRQKEVNRALVHS